MIQLIQQIYLIANICHIQQTSFDSNKLDMDHSLRHFLLLQTCQVGKESYLYHQDNRTQHRRLHTSMKLPYYTLPWWAGLTDPSSRSTGLASHAGDFITPTWAIVSNYTSLAGSSSLITVRCCRAWITYRRRVVPSCWHLNWNAKDILDVTLNMISKEKKKNQYR